LTDTTKPTLAARWTNPSSAHRSGNGDNNTQHQQPDDNQWNHKLRRMMNNIVQSNPQNEPANDERCSLEIFGHSASRCLTDDGQRLVQPIHFHKRIVSWAELVVQHRIAPFMNLTISLVRGGIFVETQSRQFLSSVRSGIFRLSTRLCRS